LQEADLLLAALQQRYGEISGESLADPHGDRVVRVPFACIHVCLTFCFVY
jgi:hypothetical protein